ncbi:50S ribosomal protein L40e [Candidatus Woesearchaeota archaeon CG10_big_fil_rev_8_21_14_0_10_32_9]|nr:MAG: 50S ribosomal protein L40e [Candidatus Woesearchaeota archaeon CG10_big_fil_rev_8_21_14_0_10_32_9]
MGKFPEAAARLLDNLFVCRRCKSKIRATNLRVLSGKISCRKCASTTLRPVRKK